MILRFSRWLSVGVVSCMVSLLGGCVTGGNPGTQAPSAARDSNALLVAAELAVQRRQFLLAAQTFTAAAAASDDESLAERATGVAFEHHQNTYVLKSAKRWLEINPTSEQAHRFAGVAALRLYRIEEAIEHFDTLVNTAFISPPAGFMSLAPQWSEEGSPAAVLELVQALVARQKKPSAEAQLVLAQAAKQADNIALAVASAQRATEISPFWLPGRLLLARLQLAANDRDGAIATIKAVIDQDNRAQNRLEYAQIVFAAGNEAEGLRELKALSDDSDVAAGARRSLALIEMGAAQWESATKRWRELVQAGRFVYEGMFYLAQISEQRGKTDDAIELYLRVNASEMAVAAQTRAALLRARAGKTADGVAVLQEFAKAHPENTIEILIAQASLLADVDSVQHGIETLEAAISEYPDNASLRISRALLLDRAKRYADAIREMRALVKERPNDPAVLNMLGYTLVDRTRNVQEGQELIKRALQLMPDNGAILDSMGWALHKQRRNDEALTHLERAYERVRDPEIAIHLGEVQWALGRQDDARKTWEKGLTAFPDNANLKKAVDAHKRAK